jgi:hypothetical protein
VAIPLQLSHRKLFFWSTTIYLSFVALEIILIVSGCQGRFIFPLDDTYIHLALADQLAHGHYGINPGEFASPSSSPLWSFLITPFAGTSFHPYFPVLLNAIFGILSMYFLTKMVGDLTEDKTDGSGFSGWKQLLVCILLMLLCDLPSLTVLGMEHGLQILLTICCAGGFIAVVSGRPVPSSAIAAAIIAPVVRYEDLSLTLALAVLLFAIGQKARAIGTFVASLVPLIAFSLFLHSIGLPPLPTSVLQKSNSSMDHSPLSSLIGVVRSNLVQTADDPIHRGPVILPFLFCLWMTARSRSMLERAIFLGPTLVGALHLMLGRFGWLHRYEVYATVFQVLVITGWALTKLTHRADRNASSPFSSASFRPSFAGLLILLLLCGGISIKAIGETPFCSMTVYRQQYQMHLFLNRFYTGNLEVNDLGAMSFQRRPGTYVFDLAGLGSVEAQQQKKMDPEWMQSIAKKHDIELAVIYEHWWPVPSTWTNLGRICEHRRGFVILGGPCVAVYSINPANNASIQKNLLTFASTLPPGVWYERP